MKPKETKSYETKKVNKVVIKERTFVDTLTDVCILILKFFAIIFYNRSNRISNRNIYRFQDLQYI